jgi:hypothetical protein
MEEARFLDTANAKIGLGTLSALFLVTVLVVPILQTLTLLRQWFSPLTPKQRIRMAILAEILQAWQYAEVYLIAIFVASWQLGPISSFMINTYCNSLDGFFAQLVYFGLLDPKDAQCFMVESKIEEGFFILAAGAVVLALINTFVMKAVTQYFRDKSTLEKRIEGDFKDEEQQGADDSDSSQTSVTNNKENDAVDPSTKIHPVPVLFTDTFRWLLKQNDRIVTSSRAFEAQFDLPKSSALGDGAKEDLSVIPMMDIDNSKSTQSAEDDDNDDVDDDEDSSQSQNGNSINSNVDVFYDDPEEEDEESGIISDDDFVIHPNRQRMQSQSINNRPDEGDNAIL